MKSYFGYDKPYIYAYCPHDCENIMEDILTSLYEQDVMFCKCDKMSKKELRRVEIAHAVVLFVNKTCLGDNDFHQVVNCAVQCGKNILTIYLEDVALDSWGHMQLDSAQALFRHQLAGEEFDRKLSEAAIFRDMAVTMQQKQFQRRRGIFLVAVPVLALVLIFTTVIYPLIKDSKGDVILGLNGLSQKELNQITELHICGDEVYTDANELECYYIDGERSEMTVCVHTVEGDTSAPVTRGSITDLTDLKGLKNLEVLEISAQQITDLTPIYKLKKLKKLGVECNPITSIEGIEALKNLESLKLSGTEITDLTPIESLSKLSSLEIEATYVTRLPNLGRRDNFGLNMRKLSYDSRDFSSLRDIGSFNFFRCDRAYISDLMPILAGKPIGDFSLCTEHLENIHQLDGLVITKRLEVGHSENLTSIEGIEKFDGIEWINLKHCEHLTDLTPLNKLKNVQTVELSTSMKPLVEAQISPDACFKIEYFDD